MLKTNKMNDTLLISVDLTPRYPWGEILITELAELGFDAFEETETGIKAYGSEDKINTNLIESSTILSTNQEFKFKLTKEIIPFQNWNANWEANFKPVFIEDKLAIFAPFHDKSNFKVLTIEIQPQMSFGTGHHQTTYLMSNSLLDEKKSFKKVLDMGTGTGVLAILAEKLGSESILAIDIEDWSVENTKENAKRNQCEKITAKHGDIDLIVGLKFDLILANINKNVLKLHMNTYVNCLENQGKLFISGFFESDAQEMISFIEKLGLKHLKTLTKETWAQSCFINN
jgi:ribosomal protein L11 methyltransferase